MDLIESSQQPVVAGSLEEIDRRGFLKGLGAAAVTSAGLAPTPAKAWFFFIIPLPNTSPDAAANACMPPEVQIGQKVNHQGELQVVQKIHGVSNRCQNPKTPVAVTVGKPEPVAPPVVQQPPNQPTTLKYGGRLAARIKPNISFEGVVGGNPAAEVEVTTLEDGTISGVRLLKPSGDSNWDKAVLKAVVKTETLPLDENGKIPQTLVLSFRPKD